MRRKSAAHRSVDRARRPKEHPCPGEHRGGGRGRRQVEQRERGARRGIAGSDVDARIIGADIGADGEGRRGRPGKRRSEVLGRDPRRRRRAGGGDAGDGLGDRRAAPDAHGRRRRRIDPVGVDRGGIGERRGRAGNAGAKALRRDEGRRRRVGRRGAGRGLGGRRLTPHAIGGDGGGQDAVEIGRGGVGERRRNARQAFDDVAEDRAELLQRRPGPRKPPRRRREIVELALRRRPPVAERRRLIRRGRRIGRLRRRLKPEDAVQPALRVDLIGLRQRGPRRRLVLVDELLDDDLSHEIGRRRRNHHIGRR